MYVNGSIQNAARVVDGTSRTYLVGSVAGNVSAKLSGISTAFIQGSQCGYTLSTLLSTL